MTHLQQAIFVWDDVSCEFMEICHKNWTALTNGYASLPPLDMDFKSFIKLYTSNAYHFTSIIKLYSASLYFNPLTFLYANRIVEHLTPSPEPSVAFHSMPP